FVGFNLVFGANPHFNEVKNGGLLFSADFSTMVGGNNATFFFIAQKATSMAATAVSDLLHSWQTANFTVSNLGQITLISISVVTPAGTGGNGLTAFTGVDSQST